MVKNLPECRKTTGDMDLIPASGISPGGGHGNPFQYSWLENFMDRGACWAIVYGVAKLGLQGWAKQSGTTRTCVTMGRERPLVQSHIWGFPGGLVVKSPPGNSGNTSSIPGLRRSMCFGASKPLRHSYWVCALEPGSCNYCSTIRGTTTRRSPHTTTESSPYSLQLEKACVQQQRSSTVKNKN